MIIKTLLALPPVAGTLTRGLTHFVRILAHVLAPQSLALCAKAYRIYIHTFMKDSYDQNFLTARLFVENNMATLRKFSVSISYFVAAFTNIRIFRQHPK